MFKWKKCVSKCYNTCHDYVKNEVESTAYMLRILTASVLGETNNYKICFLVDPDSIKNQPLVGTWDSDKQFFKIKIMIKSQENDYLNIVIPNMKKTQLFLYKIMRDYKNNSDFIEKVKNFIENLKTAYIIINLLKILNAFDSINFLKDLTDFNDNNQPENFKPTSIEREWDYNLKKIIPYLQQNKNLPPLIYEKYNISNEVLNDGTGIELKKNMNFDFQGKDQTFKEFTVNTELKYFKNFGGLDITRINLDKKMDYDFSDTAINKENEIKIHTVQILINQLKYIKEKNYGIITLITDENMKSMIEKYNIRVVDLLEKSSIIQFMNQKNGRFILGAGPSASGKTYNAGLMIQMMKMVDPLFPGFFMTIDGGTYREKSVIYQTIIDAVKNKNQYPGLTNLMSASIFDKVGNVESIFETDSIKKVINEYLLQQKNKEKFIVSLYVPDTLTFCGLFKVDCIPKLQIYIDITGDNNWIGLMIYQHETGGDGCPFKIGYKCKGCTESGKEREKTEGKKYSSGAWKFSYDHGLETIKKAPNYRIVFHNSGKRGTPSIFEDLSEEPKIPYDTNVEIQKFFDDKKIIYINGKLTENQECNDYLLKGCKIHKTPEADQNVVRIDDVFVKQYEHFVKQYNNKYIGIPKELIDILNNNKSDTITGDEITLLLIIQKFIESGFFGLTEMDPTKMEGTEADYNYYQIDMDNFNYHNDDDHFNTLMENPLFTLYLYEPEEIDKEFINYYTNKYIGIDIDKILKKNGEINKIIERFIDSGVLIPIGDDINAKKLDENDKKYYYYKIDMTKFDYFNDNFNTFIHDDSIIILDEEQNTSSSLWNSLSSATAGESSNRLSKFLSNLSVGDSNNAKSITSGAFGVVSGVVSGASQVLEGIFINKKNVGTDGISNFDIVTSITNNPIFSEENKPSDSVQTIPFVNKLIDENDVIINTPPTKKKYIGIPKSEMMSHDDNRILNDLLKGNIIEKIGVEQNLLDEEKIPGYNEKNYDYYELKIEEYLRDRIRSINSIIHDDLNVLSKNNTLYIYEIEPEQATGVSISSVSTFINNITGPTKNVLSKFVGKITGESEKKKGKEQKIDESIIETNNEAPKCDNKNTKSKRFNGTRKKNTTNDDENSVEIQGETPSTFQRLAKMAESLTNTSDTRKNKKAVVAPTRISSRNRQHIEK